MIAATDVSVSFGGIKALDRITFSCGAGQILGVVGPSGSGKTTLFDAISSRHRLASGTITIGGANIVGLAPHVVARRGLARVHQEDRTFARMTVLENVLAGTYRRDGSPAALETAAREALEAVGLRELAPAPAWQLAPGERRRLALARALASDARVVALDEPLRSLDTSERERVAALIRRSAVESGGRAIVLSDRDIDACAGLCDAVLVLHAGKAVAKGAYDELVRDIDVRDAYLGVEWRQ